MTTNKICEKKIQTTLQILKTSSFPKFVNLVEKTNLQLLASRAYQVIFPDSN